MHIHVVNLSTLVSDEQAQAMVRAVNIQVRGEFARAWDRERDSVHFSSAKSLEGCAEAVVAICNAPATSEDGILGEHKDLGDQIVGYVYAAPVIDSGGGVLTVPSSAPRGCCVSAYLSHEVLELLGNPSVNRWADDELGDAVAMELCDPCEADVYIIEAAGQDPVTVSDFVFPAYFDPGSEGPFDHLGQIKAPFGVAPLGYQIVRDGSTNKRAVWGVTSEWKAAAKACALSRTSKLCAKPKVVSVLDAVRAVREALVPDFVPLEDAERELAEMHERVQAPPPAARAQSPKKFRRVVVGKGGRPGGKPNRRVKVG